MLIFELSLPNYNIVMVTLIGLRSIAMTMTSHNAYIRISSYVSPELPFAEKY